MIAERCFGSLATCTPLNSNLDVGCIFCHKVFQPDKVMRTTDDELVDISEVKAGDHVLVGRIPIHEEG